MWEASKVREAQVSLARLSRVESEEAETQMSTSSTYEITRGVKSGLVSKRWEVISFT